MSVFAGIIGHEPILRVLTQALVKPAHAYLFCGPRGVGKKAVAECFINGLLFGVGAGLKPAPTVDAHPDFIRLAREEGAREIVVKQARELLARMQLTSACGGYKIALIEEADRLNEEAANALLKAVEEPAKNTVYIFIAEQPDRLPATLRSRLVKMEFGRVKTETIEKWLSNVGVDGVHPSPVSTGERVHGVRPYAKAAIEARGCPGAAFRLAFDESEAWFTSMDWNKLASTLLNSPLGQQLAAIEKLTQTIDSEPDPETAWREALEHLMRALDQAFLDQPQAAARLGQGLSHAWKLVGGAIPPRLAIEYALIPEEAKRGRMRPRILPNESKPSPRLSLGM